MTKSQTTRRTDLILDRQHKQQKYQQNFRSRSLELWAQKSAAQSNEAK